VGPYSHKKNEIRFAQDIVNLLGFDEPEERTRTGQRGGQSQKKKRNQSSEAKSKEEAGGWEIAGDRQGGDS